MVPPTNPRCRYNLLRLEPPLELLVREHSPQLDRRREGGDDPRLALPARRAHDVTHQEPAVDDLDVCFGDFGAGAVGVQDFELAWGELGERRSGSGFDAY